MFWFWLRHLSLSLELLFSEDLQEDTFNEDHNSLFSGDADNLSLEFVPAAGGAEAHFLLKRIGNDNVLVKVETDATALTAATVFDLATADHFEFAANFSELVANLDYDSSSYDISGSL